MSDIKTADAHRLSKVNTLLILSAIAILIMVSALKIKDFAGDELTFQMKLVESAKIDGIWDIVSA
jgi:hypothetical protein